MIETGDEESGGAVETSGGGVGGADA